MQPPPTAASSAAARNKMKNPLLSAAADDYPFTFPENSLLMPVTPATPAVLQEEPVAPPEIDAFLGQQQQHQPPSTLLNPAPPSSFPSTQPPSEPVPSQPQRQGYFTSILSSLPNLSLSAITGESPQPQQHQQQPPPQVYQPPPPSIHQSGVYGAPPNPYDFGSRQLVGGVGGVGGGDFNAGIGGAPPQLQQPPPPPAALPPSGGTPGSYRLGNQRRLKYAPPPDLTPSNAPKPSFQALPNFPPQPSYSVGAPPPTLFNPNAVQTNLRLDSHSPSAPALSATPSSQGSSLQSSFRNSPVPAAPPTGYPGPVSFTLPGSTKTTGNGQGGFAAATSAPQAIPSRLPEPATPQNTPADIAFSGFSAYRQQQQQQPLQEPGFPNAFGFTEPPKPIISSPPLNAAKQDSEPIDRTFTPISAAKVTEKLENLIAEQSDDTLSVKSELSAEVATITANIKPVTKPETEELTEIDLSSGSDPFPLSTEAKFDDSSLSEISNPLPQFYQPQPEQQQQQPQLEQQQHLEQHHQQQQQHQQLEQHHQQQQQQQLEQHHQQQQQQPQDHQQLQQHQSQLLQQHQHQQIQQDQHQQLQQQHQTFGVPSATSFFVCAPASNQNVPSFYGAPFQQQPVTDPFSFVQNKSEKDAISPISSSGPSGDNVRQNLNGGASSTPIGQGGELGYASGVGLTPQSIWGPNETQNFPSPVTQQFTQQVKSPSEQQQAPPPTFFNPSQFSSVQQTFSSIPSPNSAYVPTQNNSYVPTPIGSSHVGGGSHSVHQFTAGAYQKTFNVVPEPTGSATLSPEQMSVNPLTSSRSPHQETVPPSLQNLASGLPEKQMQYRPVYHHWFYRREVETKTLWLPFSMQDSLNLEDVHNSNEISPETKVATDGGRYDVEILRRQRSPVYWTGPITEVRRCSWFYKGQAESRYTPYDESVSARLEEEFKQACTTNNWNRRVDLNNGEYIIFHSSTVQAHYLQATTPELAASWGNNAGSEDNAYLQSSASRPRVVKRGMDEFNIDDGEPEKVDHLLFLVHGIGSVCDLKFRTVEEVVDEFRSISLQLVQSHYRNSSEQGIVNRIEVLPISWHATLHSGIDKKLQVITLESIPKLRHFTNDTLLDILFYTSPIYCETIMQTVGTEMNRLYSLFNQRNPDFQGNVYLGGHSLGSLIVFDLLCHQKPAETEESEINGETLKSEETSNEDGTVSIKPLAAPVLKRKLSKRVSYVMGTAGTGQPFINYPQLAFNPRAFFALGSPIGMFVTVRGIDNLGEDFTLPTCPAFFNIFHPFDPVAYRVESLINSEAHKYRPMLIPHHKGRKRMHLELKETMARVGADLKQKLLESVRNTWNSVYQLAMFHRQDNQTLEQEIEKVVEEQMNAPRADSLQSSANDDTGHEIKIGKLNGGRRIDYVLQEAPFEYINEYLFALTSHVCYWESEDTMLMILKEIYGSMGIQTDAQLPQQSLSIERVSTPSMSANHSTVTSPTSMHGLDPTAPASSRAVGPPPTTGFVRKS